MSHCAATLLALFVWALGAESFHSDASLAESVLSASLVQTVDHQHPKKLSIDHLGHVEAEAEHRLAPLATEYHADPSDSSSSSGSHDTTTESGGHHEEEDPLMEHEHEVLAEHLKPSPAADSVAFMLLGMIIFQVAVYYLVNFPDDDVRHFTWISLSQTISIFCSLTIWETITSTLEYGMGEESSPNALADEVSPDEGHPFRVAIMFAILFAIFHSLMCRCWSHHTSCNAFGVIAAHTLGFAAVDVVSQFLIESPCKSMFSFHMVTLLVGLIFFGLLSLATYIRSKVCENWRDTEENNLLVDQYLQVCIESENEFAGFVLGLLVTQAIVWNVTGIMPPAHGFSFEKNMTEVEGLLIGAAVTMVSLFVFVIFIRKAFKDEASPMRTRAIEITEMTLSMAIGWTFLFAGRWFFWVSTDDHGIGAGDLMSARMVQALAFSGFCFANIFVLDFMSDRDYLDHTALKALMNTMGILMGLAWESAFGEAIENIGREFAATPQAKFTLMSGMGIMSSIIVLPAWYFYILPQALAGAEADEQRELRLMGNTTVGWKVQENGKLRKTTRMDDSIASRKNSSASLSDWSQEPRIYSHGAARGSNAVLSCNTRE